MQAVVRTFPPVTFVRFLLAMAVAVVPSIALFWLIVFLFAGGTIPDLSSASERSAFVMNTGILLRYVFAPVFVVALVTGYPVWRFASIRVLSGGQPGWLAFALSGIAVSAVAVGITLALFAFVASNGMTPIFGLAFAVFGCLSIGLFVASWLVCR